MRRMMICSVGLSIAVFLGGISLASLASAQASTTTGTTKHTELEELRAAHKLLVNADHDYDGHRAKASEEVHKAIKELESKRKVKKPVVTPVVGATPVVGTTTVKAKEPAIHESQGSSDAQVRQALTILQGVEGQLKTGHPKAAESVAKAISELNTALKLK